MQIQKERGPLDSSSLNLMNQALWANGCGDWVWGQQVGGGECLWLNMGYDEEWVEDFKPIL